MKDHLFGTFHDLWGGEKYIALMEKKGQSLFVSRIPSWNAA